MENKTQKLIHEMLLANTGVAMMDSGGDEGRAWQRNRKIDPATLPQVSLEIPELPAKSDEIDITVSLYHYLPTVLELDDVCDEFNALLCDEWNTDVYGISEDQKGYLEARGFTFASCWNSYNGESNLSQVLQGTELKRDGLGEGDYVLLQVHGGADVRGGYTDARLFKYQRFEEMIDPCPRVTAAIQKKSDGSVIELEMRDSGYGFVDSDGEPVTIEEGDVIEAGI